MCRTWNYCLLGISTIYYLSAKFFETIRSLFIFFFPLVLGWSDAAHVSLSLAFWTDLSSALSDGQSVKELVEDDVSWCSPLSLFTVFVFSTLQRSQTSFFSYSKPFCNLLQAPNEDGVWNPLPRTPHGNCRMISRNNLSMELNKFAFKRSMISISKYTESFVKI